MNLRYVITVTFHCATCLTYFAAVVNFTRLHGILQFSALTVWDLWVQFLYFGLCIIVDFEKPSIFNFDKMVPLRDKVFSSLAVPCAEMVFILYWCMLVPMSSFGVSSSIHTWINHVSHTVILPVILFDMWLVKHRYPRRMEGLTVTLLFGVSYVSVCLYHGMALMEWPYSILHNMNFGYRALFFGGCFIALIIFYVIGEKLNTLIWGSEDAEKNNKTGVSEKLLLKGKDDLTTPICIEMGETAICAPNVDYVCSPDGEKMKVEQTLNEGIEDSSSKLLKQTSEIPGVIT